MANKTMVRLKNNDSQYKEYQKGEEGYIDGYTRGGDNRPYVVVIIDNRIIMCMAHELEVIDSCGIYKAEE